MKWDVGYFEWADRVQTYQNTAEGLDYMKDLDTFVEDGFVDVNRFIDVVGRALPFGCSETACMAAEDTLKQERRDNFINLVFNVLNLPFLVETATPPPTNKPAQDSTPTTKPITLSNPPTKRPTKMPTKKPTPKPTQQPTIDQPPQSPPQSPQAPPLPPPKFPPTIKPASYPLSTNPPFAGQMPMDQFPNSNSDGQKEHTYDPTYTLKPTDEESGLINLPSGASLGMRVDLVLSCGILWVVGAFIIFP